MSKKRSGGSNLVKQGSILALAGIIVKFIGFIYKIPLQSDALIGNNGYAYYNFGFQVYGMLLVISAYGVPMALSKIISEKRALGKYGEAEQALRVTTVFCLILSIIASLFMWFGSDFIANTIFRSPGSSYTMKALAPNLIILGFICVLRGYFQGHNTMVPTAVSQIIEQIFNVSSGLLLASLLVKNSIELGAAGATLGATIGSLSACLFLYYIFIAFRNKSKKHRYSKSTGISNKKMLRDILYVLIPITVVAAISSIINLLDSSMFPNGMASHGYTKEIYESMYGLYAGKFVLLTNFPISIATALAAASVPSIAASIVKKEYKLAQSKMNKIIKITCLITLPAAMGLGVLANPILETIFRGDKGLDLASDYLRSGSIIVFLFSIFQITNAILQSMHKVKEPVKNMLIAGSLKVLLNVVFLFLLDLQAKGLIYSSIVFGVMLCLLNIKSIYRYSKVRFNWIEILMKPLLASIIMGLLSMVAYKLLILILGTVASCLISVIVGVISYGLILIVIKGINRDELLLLPYGDKLANLLHMD